MLPSGGTASADTMPACPRNTPSDRPLATSAEDVEQAARSTQELIAFYRTQATAIQALRPLEYAIVVQELVSRFP